MELVGCTKCGLDTPPFVTEAEAIAAWNTRPKIEAQGSEPGGARWRPRAELLAMLDGLLATYMKGERLPDVVDMSALSEAAECIRALTRPDPSLGSEPTEAMIKAARDTGEWCTQGYVAFPAEEICRAVLKAVVPLPPYLGMEGVRAPDSRYPFVYHDRANWRRVGIGFSQGSDFIRVDTMLENKPGAAWWPVEMTPDEAEQMGLRLIERARTARQALASISTASGEVGT